MCMKLWQMISCTPLSIHLSNTLNTRSGSFDWLQRGYKTCLHQEVPCNGLVQGQLLALFSNTDQNNSNSAFWCQRFHYEHAVLQFAWVHIQLCSKEKFHNRVMYPCLSGCDPQRNSSSDYLHCFQSTYIALPILQLTVPPCMFMRSFSLLASLLLDSEFHCRFWGDGFSPMCEEPSSLVNIVPTPPAEACWRHFP